MACSSDAINVDGIVENWSSEGSLLNREKKKSVDEVWREIVEGKVEESKCKPEAMSVDEVMTLEEFLVHAGAVGGGEVKVESGTERYEGFGSPVYLAGSGSGIMGYEYDYEDGVQLMGGSGRVVRGKRRVSPDHFDKAAQQRQRRMIKNRESAARSRERKQAYQVELETMAVRLEEENEMLVKEKGERMKERFRQLMQNVIPVVEKRRPARFLRRVRSMEL